ncbi:MAG: cytochrome ubiquinol oxidase subunit I [Castellaniella sp.]
MTHTTLWLAQIQFFASVGFLLLFLVLELGLAWGLLVLRALAMGQGRVQWLPAYRLWARVFALAVALGFAASVPVLVQTGTLWPGLLARIGEVSAPLLAGLILSSFVFKACFLGGMLFGERRLAPPVHLAMVAMVALGVTVSAFCFLALVSWLQAPTGALMVDGRYALTNLAQVVLNPALLPHGLWLAGLSALSVAFLMMSVSCGQARRNPADVASRGVFRMGLGLAVTGLLVHSLAMLDVVRFAAEHQPAKAAATAALWESGPRADLLVLGWPDEATATNRLGLTWPGRGGGLLAEDGKGHWRGLDQFSGMAPPVALTFWSFRLCVFISLLLALVTLANLWWLYGRRRDLASLPRLWSGLNRGLGLAGWPLLLSALAWVQFGAYPYAVQGTVTLSEVLAPQSGVSLFASGLAWLLCQGLLILGFVQLLRHVAHHGVVPVRRQRRRA